MRKDRNRWQLLLGLAAGLVASISVGYAIDKDKAKFDPGPISSFTTKQSSEGVTVAAEAYETEALAERAFGKVNPYMYGVLPVLVMVQNDTREAISLTDMVAEYIDATRDRIDATPAHDVQFLRPPKKPSTIPSPLPKIVQRPKKNPLAAWEIEGRAFAAKMLPPGESAYGFFYFQTGHHKGAKLYVKGIRIAASGKELLYYEIPLEAH